MGKDNLLTDMQCRRSKPLDKEYFLNDGNGLRLQIKPNGNKIWQFRFTFNSKRRTTTFESYPKVTLENARKKKINYLDLIVNGIDPIEDKKKVVEAKRIDELSKFDNILYEWLEKEKPNASLNQYEWKKNRFEKDVLPFLKDKLIKDIKIKDIKEVIQNKNKTAPETASKLFSYLKKLFSYAVLSEYCERNIMLEIDKSHLITKTIVKNLPKITDEQNFKELVNAIYSYNGSFSVKNALKLVLHIPLRAENLCTLKWSNIDFEKKLIIIPREQMKLKNPNFDDFKIPLSNEVINILQEQKKELELYANEFDYVFVGNDHKRHINKESPNKALKTIGFNDEKKGRKITLHGFRGTFRSLIDTLDTENKFSFDTKEKALDHQETNKVVRAYSHKADFTKQLQELMNFWSDYLNNLLNYEK